MENKNLLLLIFTTLFFCYAKASTTVPALITSNQVWTLSGSPYLINQNSYIDVGVTVKVMPGVVISGSGVYKLAVDGEFQAIGKWDSIINISKVEFDFSAKSVDYNVSTGKGAYFKYCNFTGNGSGSNTISGTNTSLKVDYCVFSNIYDGLYIGGSDSILLEVSNSKFTGDKNSSGSPIYCYNMASKLIILNNYFSNSDDFHTYGSIIFKNNTINKVRTSYIFIFGNSEFSCNKFSNMTGGLGISLYASTGKNKFIFNNNTLDSMGSASSYGMFNLGRNSSGSVNFGSIEVHENNFLYNKNQPVKVQIIGTNQTPTKTDTIDFKSNYWGSTNPATIATYIKDYNDDINIYGRVDFSSYKSGPVIGCSYNNACARANFNYMQTDSVVTFHDTSYSTKYYKVRWNFGDGKSDNTNKKSIRHDYSQAGQYIACLYVSDTNNNLCDSICQTIVVKNKSKCKASYYFAIDSNDASIVYIVNTSKGVNFNTHFYWTFGDGSGSTNTNPSHTYANAGTYQLCLTIFDTTVGCYSTFCDSVEIDSNNIMLIILNDKDVLSILNSSVFHSVSAYPNPSTGRLKLQLNTNRANVVSIDILNTSGQIMKSDNYGYNIGSNEINLDLSEFENGLYCINIRSEGFSKTIKIVLNK